MGHKKGVQKSVLLATRVTPGINDKIKQLAFREGLYVSEWIRHLIVSELKSQNMLGNSLRLPQNDFLLQENDTERAR